MAKTKPKAAALDDRSAALHALRAAPADDAARQQLADALADKQNLVVARAADVVAAHRLAELTPQLVESFARLMRGGDKGCVGKTAVAKALEAVDAVEPDTFKQGIRHVQLESTWGGRSDVAVDLRATCALALSRLNRPDVLLDLTDLLADAEAPARLAAARAIGHCGREEGSLPLRLKVRLGHENEPNVTAECFVALLKIAPAKNLDFVAEFLDSKDTDFRDAAALALGESRQPVAFDRLLARYERELMNEPKRVLLLALAQTRHPKSLDVLVPIIAERNTTLGAWAIESLAPYRADDVARHTIAAAVASATTRALPICSPASSMVRIRQSLIRSSPRTCAIGVTCTPSPRCAGERAGERGERCETSSDVRLLEHLAPLPRPLPRVRGRGRSRAGNCV